jgi:carboxypeptidase Taq
VSDARYAQLRERLGHLWDIVKLTGLADWDQQTMMPPAGASVRAYQLATGSKLVHDLMVADELGKLLEEIRPYEESLDYDSDEASLIRWTRRDREKELRVPAELREEESRAAAEAFPVWVEARRTSDFGLFRPYLERNVELRRRYAECFEVAEPYDALLDDFEPGMKTEEVRTVFERLKEGLVPLIAEASAQEIDDSMLRGRFPIEAQKELELVLLDRFGFREGSWRIAGSSIRSPLRWAPRTSA